MLPRRGITKLISCKDKKNISFSTFSAPFLAKKFTKISH
jgi:hypothetical protein